MRTDTLTTRVRRTVATVTDEPGAGPIELLFVGQESVWLVLSADRIGTDDALIEVFQAVQSLPGVETLYVERVDPESPGTRPGPDAL